MNNLDFDNEVSSIDYSDDNKKMIVIEGTGYERVLKWSLFSMPDAELIKYGDLPKKYKKVCGVT